MKFTSLVITILSFAVAARADDETSFNWIARLNALDRSLVPVPVERYEEVAALMEANDYLRYSGLAASKVVHRDLSPARPTPLEREIIYGAILNLRFREWTERASDQNRENVGIAYRRLARCEKLHLWSRLLVMQAMYVVDGEVNIGWEQPEPEGFTLQWTFINGGVDPSRSTVLDDYRALYEDRVGHRRTNPVESLIGFFAMSFLFTTQHDDLIFVDRARLPFAVEIDDQDGNAIKNPRLDQMAAEERRRIRREIEEE